MQRSKIVQRRKIRHRLLGTAVAATLASAAAPALATITFNAVSGTDWAISNGALSINFNPTKSNINSVKVAGFNTNILDPANKQIYPQFAGTPFGAGAMTANYQQTANYIDFWTTTQSTGTAVNPITYSFHYVMFDNDPAVHMYQVLNHSASDPVAKVDQGQFLARVDPTLFYNTYQYDVSVNNPGAQTSTLNNYATQAAVGSQPGRTVQDATTDLNGSGLPGNWGTHYFTKYDYSSYEQFHQGQTEYGSTYAISTVLPSKESMTGGPTKQNLQFTNNIMMAEFLSGHYNGGDYSYTPQQGVNTSRLFGPYVFRITTTNNKTGAQLYQEAINTIPTYNALYNQNTTLIANGYVPSHQRGTVQVNATNAGGWSANINDNMVVLSDPLKDYQQSTKGYQYWSQVSPTGTARLAGVVPGTYRLSLYRLGQWGETRVDGVQVNAGQVTLPQNLKFTPENFGTAAPIWTLGTPDRSSNEFLNGHNTSGGDQRQYYGAYNYWQQQADLGNPGKVVYYATAVGAKPATNDVNKWIANQWGLFNPGEYAGVYNAADQTTGGYKYIAPAYVGDPATYKGLPWEIHFTTTAAQKAQGQFAILSVSLAGAYGSLIVKLNGTEQIWHSSNTGNPMVRSGVSGYTQWMAYQFPASLLNAAGADNIFTFSVSQNYGALYDALRFEITNTTADPAVTGWHDYTWVIGSNAQLNADPTFGQSIAQTVSAQPGLLRWNNAGGAGNGTAWETNGNANWNSGAVTTTFKTNDDVAFDDNNNGHYAVTLAASVTPGSVMFNHSAGNYTLGGAGGIGGATSLVKYGSGKLTVSTVNTYTGGTTINAGTIVAAVANALPNGNVDVSSVATLQLAPGTGLSTIKLLTIDAGGVVDLTSNELITTSPLAAIRAQIIAGLLRTTTAGGVLGSLDRGNGTTDVKFTLAGDTNLDGTVNVTDLGNLASNYGKTIGGVWGQGDINYNGTVDIADLGLVASNYGDSIASGAVAMIAESVAVVAVDASTVPEPSTLALLLLIPNACARRRSRAPRQHCSKPRQAT